LGGCGKKRRQDAGATKDVATAFGNIAWKVQKSANGLFAAVGAGIELVGFHLAAECVAVDSENFCGAGLISVGAFERAPDKFLFELVDRFIEHNSAFDQLSDQRFQLIFHVRTLRPVSSTFVLLGPQV